MGQAPKLAAAAIDLRLLHLLSLLQFWSDLANNTIGLFGGCAVVLFLYTTSGYM